MSEAAAGIRRILLALSGAAEELASIDAAADLAAALGAELTALFIEDVNLLRASRLPMMWEMGRYSAQLRQVQADSMVRLLKAAARRSEQALLRAAQARSLRCSFHVLQGKPVHSLLAQAARLDLVVLGQRAVFGKGSLRPLVVLFDGSMAAAATLAVGLKLARATGRPCLVLVLAADAPTYRERLQQATWAVGEPQQVILQRLQDASPTVLSQVVNGLHAAALVLPAEYAEDDIARLDTLRTSLNCDLLLVT